MTGRLQGRIALGSQRCTGVFRLLSKFQAVRLLFRLVSKMKRNCWTRPSREELIERGSNGMMGRSNSTGCVAISTSTDDDRGGDLGIVSDRYDYQSESVPVETVSTCHLPDFKERVTDVLKNITPFVPSYPLSRLNGPQIITQCHSDLHHRQEYKGEGLAETQPFQKEVSSDLEDGEIVEERQNCEFPIKFRPIVRTESGSQSVDRRSTGCLRPDSSSIGGTEWSVDGPCPISNSCSSSEDFDAGDNLEEMANHGIYDDKPYRHQYNTRIPPSSSDEEGDFHSQDDDYQGEQEEDDTQQESSTNDNKNFDQPSKLIVPAKYRGGRAYELLGLSRNDVQLGRVTDKDIKKAYRKCAVAAHPDKGGEHAVMQDLNETNDFLTKHKVAYDEISGIRDRNGRAGLEYNDL